MVILLFICLALTSCDDIGKPKKLAVDTADVAGDVLEIVGTISGNDAIKELGEEIERKIESLDEQK